MNLGYVFSYFLLTVCITLMAGIIMTSELWRLGTAIIGGFIGGALFQIIDYQISRRCYGR